MLRKRFLQGVFDEDDDFCHTEKVLPALILVCQNFHCTTESSLTTGITVQSLIRDQVLPRVESHEFIGMLELPSKIARQILISTRMLLSLFITRLAKN